LPQTVALRPTLVPEGPVYASAPDGEDERAISGIVDAFSLDASGQPHLVIDWKSDVEATVKAIEDYRTPIQAHLETAKIGEGLLVFVTSGTVILVRRPNA
jgi:hypothetical protein